MTNSNITYVDVYFDHKGRYWGYAGRLNLKPRIVRMDFDKFEKFIEMPQEIRHLGRALLYGEEIKDGE